MTVAIDIEDALGPIILDDAGVAAIVGDKGFPNRVPTSDSLPAVIWRRTSGGPKQTLSGQSSLKTAAFQVESWSPTSQKDARQLDLAVQAAIAAFGGQKTQSGWWVQAIFVEEDSDQDNPQIPIHADDLGLFCSYSNVLVFYHLAS